MLSVLPSGGSLTGRLRSHGNIPARAPALGRNRCQESPNISNHPDSSTRRVISDDPAESHSNSFTLTVIFSKECFQNIRFDYINSKG